MNAHRPADPPACADGAEMASFIIGTRPGRPLIAVLLGGVAALDLSRCAIVLVTARHGTLAAGLVAMGLTAAVLSLSTARGIHRGQRWAAWAALLIGAASAPQAAASGFHALYAVPNTATAVLGALLAVAVLATAGQPGQIPGNPQCGVGHRHCAGERPGRPDQRTAGLLGVHSLGSHP